MRALTVRQPWAWGIVHGGKDVENRVRNIAGDYRGPVAIHAGKNLDEDGCTDLRLIQAAQALHGEDGSWGEHLTFGAIVGVVDLWAVHTARPGCCQGRDEPFGSAWAMPSCFHLCLRNPRPIPHPIPARGYLHLWTPDDDLEAEIAEQLARSRS